MNDQFESNKENKECSAIGYQTVDVCVPVTVKPFGSAGNIKTHCEGKPVVVEHCGHCPGTPGGTCQFTISQKLRVEVPVIFGARAEVGEAFVDCGRKCPYDKPEDFTPEEIEKTPDEEDEIQ